MFDELSGWETDPNTILFNLRGLPAFLKSDEEPDTTIMDPAFSTSPGPVSFIHEVIMLPAKEPQAPDEVFMLLEEARISQNVGHYETALAKLHAARLLWEDKSSWAMIKAGLDPVTVYARAQRARERVAREAARDEEVEERWRERDRRDRAEDDSRRQALEAEARLVGNIAFLMEKADTATEDVKARDADREREREQFAREVAQRELRRRSREGLEEAEAMRYTSIEAQTCVATETEFYVHLFLHAGSVYGSAGDAASALAMHWRALTAYRRYLDFAAAHPDQVHAEKPPAFFASSLVAPLRSASAGEPSVTMAQRLGLGATDIPLTNSFAPAQTATATSMQGQASLSLAVSAAAAEQGLLITLDDVPGVALAPDTALAAAAPPPAWAAVVSRAQAATGTYAYPLSAPAPTAAAGGIDAFMRWAARQSFGHMALEDIDVLHGACPLLGTIYSCLAADCHRLGETALSLSCLSAVRSIRFLCLPEDSLEFADAGSCLNNIGVCLSKLRHFREARAYFHAALEVLETRLEPLHPRVSVARNNLNKVMGKAPLTRVDLSSLESAGQGQGKPVHMLKAQARPLVTNAYQRMLLEAAAPKKPVVVEEKKK